MAQVVTSWFTPVRTWSLVQKLAGTQPATSTNWGCFWRAPVACKVTGVNIRYGTISSQSGSTCMLVKVPTGTAVAAGTVCLASNLTLDTVVADTDQPGTLHATAANYTLAAGDSLAFLPSATLTALANFAGTVEVIAV